MLIINDILAFIIELASLILYGRFAYQLSENTIIRILFVILSIGIFAVIWGRYFAPSAPNPLEGWLRWVLEFAILFLPWVLYYHDKYPYVIIAGIVIIANLAIQAIFGRSNLG